MREGPGAPIRLATPAKLSSGEPDWNCNVGSITIICPCPALLELVPYGCGTCVISLSWVSEMRWSMALFRYADCEPLLEGEFESFSFSLRRDSSSSDVWLSVARRPIMHDFAH